MPFVKFQFIQVSACQPVFYLCLRMCLESVLTKTVLRQVAVLVFYLCLRQKIVPQIQIQFLLNTLAPIQYLFFLKTENHD